MLLQILNLLLKKNIILPLTWHTAQSKHRQWHHQTLFYWCFLPGSAGSLFFGARASLRCNLLYKDFGAACTSQQFQGCQMFSNTSWCETLCRLTHWLNGSFSSTYFNKKQLLKVKFWVILKTRTGFIDWIKLNCFHFNTVHTVFYWFLSRDTTYVFSA